ncbi:MAG: PhzF family phenazine biosynthesis protein [Pseudomonadales bacterium]
MRVTIVDVFAESRYAGNQLAVVHDAEQLDSATMQSIAREMNFSETTFVLSHEGNRATVRIFTPDQELPFAGHPTVGTAWVLAGGTGTITLDLPAGPVPVVFEDGIGWMTPPPVQLKDTFEPSRAAALLGLPESALAPEYPLQFAEVGPKFVLIGLRDLESLRAIELNQALYRQYQSEGYAIQCVFAFTEDAYEPAADYASRMFFYSAGFREDPATGSANSAFAAYLLEHRGALGSVVVDQGVEMRRPSRLYLRVQEPLQVGGRVIETLSGTLT